MPEMLLSRILGGHLPDDRGHEMRGGLRGGLSHGRRLQRQQHGCGAGDHDAVPEGHPVESRIFRIIIAKTSQIAYQKRLPEAALPSKQVRWRGRRAGQHPGPAGNASGCLTHYGHFICGAARIWHTRTMLDRVDFEPIFFAPFVSSVMKVEPAWIDYNGHLNMAYYNVLFDRAVDEVYEPLDCGAAYVRKGFSTFTAEVHVRYLRELHEGDPVRGPSSSSNTTTSASISSSSSLTPKKAGFPATSENIALHVDMAAKKVAPFRPEVTRRLLQMRPRTGNAAARSYRPQRADACR